MSFFSDIGNAIKDFGNTIYSEGLKPLYENTIGAGINRINRVSDGVVNGAGAVLENVGGKLDRLGNSGLNLVDGLTNFLSNPLFMIGVVIVGGIVVVKLL